MPSCSSIATAKASILWGATKLAEGNKPADQRYSVAECLRRLLPEKDYNPQDNEWVKELIQRRFIQRFIRPLVCLTNTQCRKQSGDDYVAVGFTIMAIASLMIETLACFRNGQWTTHKGKGGLKACDPRWGSQHEANWRNGKESFKIFLEDTGNSFNSGGILFGPGEGEVFYTEIRCGILHQAEAQGEWRILRKGECAVKRNPNTINAIKFLELLDSEFKRYIENLDDHADSNNVNLWKSCRYKLLGICNSSGWRKPWQLDSGAPIVWADYW